MAVSNSRIFLFIVKKSFLWYNEASLYYQAQHAVVVFGVEDRIKKEE
jgi:hypothetical protein